jgi:hypothetical protein
MSTVLYLIIGAAVAVAGSLVWDCFLSFRAQRLSDYATERPAFDVSAVLSGDYSAHGAIFDYTGRANARFSAKIKGRFDDKGGILAERFEYDGSNIVDTREWKIHISNPSSFTATAPDVIGIAKGQVSGNSVRMTYRLQLPDRAGGHILDVVDWLYLMEDGTIINRSEMRKFGLRAAELFAVFVPEAEAPQ